MLYNKYMDNTNPTAESHERYPAPEAPAPSDVAFPTRELELAIFDTDYVACPPYIKAKGIYEEKVLKPETSVSNYMSYAFHKAFIARGRRGQPLNHYKPTTAEQRHQHTEETYETAITRLGKKYNHAQAAAQKLAVALLLDETAPDTPETMLRRATIFKAEVLRGTGPIAQAFANLKGFIQDPVDRWKSSVSGNMGEMNLTLDYLQETLDGRDIDKLDRLAKITLAHEIKLADYFRWRHDQFAAARLEYKLEHFGDAFHFTMQNTVIDVTSRAAGSESESASQEVAIYEPEGPVDPLERFWRRGLERLRKFGRFLIQKALRQKE